MITWSGYARHGAGKHFEVIPLKSTKHAHDALPFYRDGGDPSKAQGHLPKNKQYLVTRNGNSQCAAIALAL